MIQKSKNVKVYIKQHDTEKKKRLLVLPIVVLLLLAVTAGLFWLNKKEVSDMQIVAYVNNEPIRYGEYRMFLFSDRAAVMNYFKETYHTEIEQEFWNKNYNNEAPLERIMDEALKQSVDAKIKQILSKKYSVETEIDYKVFTQKLKTENVRRKNAVENNQVIYGPQQYEEFLYYKYLLDIDENKVKENMLSNELNINDEVLEAFYQREKEAAYIKNPGTTTVRVLTVYFTDDKGNISPEKKKAAREKITQIKSEFKSGTEFEELQSKYNEEKSLEELTVGADNEKELAMIDSGLFTGHVSELVKGQVSDVIEANSNFKIIFCVDKGKPKVKLFNEVKDVLTRNYVDKEYINRVEVLTKEAKVVLKDKVYEKLIKFLPDIL